ncbi:MAG: hypothetical protein JF887_09320 [Candidatus Dormibacteraeota bacterium]|uniref:Uncharacterized protein n=1 Tax=Candidatus Amunia macphersoniae TaxID=3127014 RepID=A0A934NF86_9BACT|nr:hypothetical protein [Candidatus Dormibacteraeota bacterium]
MADDGSVGRPRAVAELLFVHRLRPLPRAGVAGAIAATCCLLGGYGLEVQTHFAAARGGGRLSTFLAHGSTAATAWAGWAAALFFLLALFRVRGGPPEPPAGRAPVEKLTIAQLRAGLVREYTVARAGLTVLTLVAVVDAARAGRYLLAALGGDSIARGSLVATVVEAVGLAVAAVVLALWALGFRSQLVRIGALDR